MYKLKSNSSKLYIKKRPFLTWLAFFIFIMPFFMSFLLDVLRISSIVKYSIDAAWFVGIVLLFMKRKMVFDRKFIPFLIFIGLFLLYTLIGYLFNYQSIFYYLWGLRNNFRFYFAFILFCMLFTEEDADFCLKFMDILFWINLVVSFYQFFVMGIEQDYLGGVFGIGKGCNGYSLAFFSIVLSKSLLNFMSKKESMVLCFSKCAATLFLAAMAELKYFFVVFMMILIFSSIMTAFSFKKFIIIALAVVLVSMAGSMLANLFGDEMELTLETLFSFATNENYSSENDLGRLTAIPTLSRTIMDSSVERLFGLGLGNCDTSNFAICNTPFYQTYEYLHYNWFSSAFLFLETGIVGFIIYLLFFVMCFFFSSKQKKREGTNELFCQMAMIISVISVTLTFYNSSLRAEVGYMVFFVLALPFIDSREKIRRLENNYS